MPFALGSLASAPFAPAVVTKGPPSNGALSENATSGISEGRPAKGNLFARDRRDSPPTSDSPQIRMPGKPDPQHVVDLALMPISRPPDARDGRRLGRLLGQVGLKPKMTAMAVAVELVNQRETRIIAVIVYAAEIDEIIEAQLPLAYSQTSATRSASLTSIVISPRNSTGAEIKSPNCSRSWLALSVAVMIGKKRKAGSGGLFLGLLFRKHRLFGDLALHLDQRIQQRLRPRRTSRDIHIDGYDVVNALKH